MWHRSQLSNLTTRVVHKSAGSANITQQPLYGAAMNEMVVVVVMVVAMVVVMVVVWCVVTDTTGHYRPGDQPRG